MNLITILLISIILTLLSILILIYYITKQECCWSKIIEDKNKIKFLPGCDSDINYTYEYVILNNDGLEFKYCPFCGKKIYIMEY